MCSPNSENISKNYVCGRIDSVELNGTAMSCLCGYAEGVLGSARGARGCVVGGRAATTDGCWWWEGRKAESLGGWV